jgi:hypothetical protein
MNINISASINGKILNILLSRNWSSDKVGKFQNRTEELN